MIRAYKYRLYPDNEARAYFARCFGATRYCYNFCVREYDKACSEGRQLSGFDIAARLREHMNGVKWMADVDYEIKESAPSRFDNALGKFKRHEANRPREHKKGDRPTMSYTTGGIVKVDFKHDLVQLPKIGVVSARLHRTFSGDITSATIKREADGHYYVCLNVKNDEPTAPLKPHTTEGTIGIDVGIRHLATLSNGDHFEMPDTSRITDRITFLKNRLEKQTPGSRRYNRTAFQIAKYHHHIANIAKDTHHKAAARLCRDYDTICMETLNVAGMKRGKPGEKTAGDVVFNAQLHRMALALFIERIQKKAADTGTNFVGIDRFEPSTKRCHVCGYVLPTISLDVEAWTCPECGTRHDRDENAAINIRNKGLEQLQAMPPKAARTETLPLAEGNVMPAKKTTAGCNLRTGKGKAATDRPPKAQIADGTAPPRIFKEPQFEIPEELKYFKVAPLITRAGITKKQFQKWMEQLIYGEIPDDMKAMHDQILTTIKQVADELRHTKVKYDRDRAGSQKVLGLMNKVVRADWLIAEVMPVEPNYTIWRSRRRNIDEIRTINRVVTRQFPDRLIEMVARLKNYAYEAQSCYTDTTDEFLLKSQCFHYLKIYRIARMTGITTYAINKWLWFKYKYGEQMFKFDDISQLLQTLKEFASQLRGMEITETNPKKINRQLKAMEKDLWMENVLLDAGLYQVEDDYDMRVREEAYKQWQAADKTKEDIATVNQVVCYELPELIDRFVVNELPALQWEIQSVARQ